MSGRVRGPNTASAIAGGLQVRMRGLHWPDAFPAAEPQLQRAAGVTSRRALLRLAERWRPWRAYAATHLRLYLED